MIDLAFSRISAVVLRAHMGAHGNFGSLIGPFHPQKLPADLPCVCEQFWARFGRFGAFSAILVIFEGLNESVEISERSPQKGLKI